MSGNLRPFREDPTSYSRTGIPCGDPTRYDSRGVIRMAPNSRPFKNQNIEAPVEDIETEGERQLHSLAKQQLETNVFVDGKLVRKKSFTPSTVLDPLTAQVSGALSKERYQRLEDHDRHVEDLRQYGLREDEISLLLQTEGVGLDGQPAKRIRFGIDPEAHADKLSQIRLKIEQKKASLKEPDKFAGARYMSRHELDLERAISHNRDKARLLGMLVTQAPSQAADEDPNDPINNLHTIMDEVMENERSNSRRARARRRKAHLPVATCAPRPEGYISNIDQNKGPVCPLCRLVIRGTGQGQEEEKKGEEDEGKKGKGQEDEVDRCRCSIMNADTVTEVDEGKEGEETVRKQVEPVPEQLIRENRLTVEEIKNIPRFKDYHPGQPSHILYLKNLNRKVSEEDLLSLFMRYEEGDGADMEVKLMTGRMKGQAFITFTGEDTATKALELVNGYSLKGKPIIIQYGKPKT